MNKRTIGFVITALIIGAMIVIMVKSNVEKKNSTDDTVVGTDTTSMDVATGLKKGDTPPDFELSTLSGEVVKLSDFKGKKIILNFWASWCGPCKAEMPHMQNYYKKHKESANVEIVAVNLTAAERKGLQGVEDFIDAYGLTFKIPLDKDGKVMDTYRIIPIPTTYMIGTDGKIAHEIVGPMDEKMMKELVDGLE